MEFQGDDMMNSYRSATIEPEDDSNITSPNAFQRNLKNGGEKPASHLMDSIDRDIEGLDINMNSIESNKNKKEEFPGQFEMKNKLEALKK